MKRRHVAVALAVALFAVVAYSFLSPTAAGANNFITPEFYDANKNPVGTGGVFSVVTVGGVKTEGVSFMKLNVNVKNTGQLPLSAFIESTSDTETDVAFAALRNVPRTLGQGQAVTFTSDFIPVAQWEGTTRTLIIQVSALYDFAGQTKKITQSGSVTLKVDPDPVAGFTVNVTTTGNGTLSATVVFVEDPVGGPGPTDFAGGIVRASIQTNPNRVSDRLVKTFNIPATVDLSRYKSARLEVYGMDQRQRHNATKADVLINGVDVYTDAIPFNDFLKNTRAPTDPRFGGWNIFSDVDIKPYLRSGDNTIDITLNYLTYGGCVLNCGTEPPDLYAFRYQGYINPFGELDTAIWNYWGGNFDPPDFTAAMRIVLSE